MSTNGFVFFEGGLQTSPDTPNVTVRKGGLLVLTNAAIQMLGDDVTYVMIGYNVETGQIGIQRSSQGQKGSYFLREQKNSSSRLVDGRSMFSHHELSVEQSVRLTPEKISDGLIAVTLPGRAKVEPTPVKTPAKSRKAA